ncbi:RHS repeat domain-containing protein [Streptomyces cellostaticus]|uniref:RHS repeat domain-containing protein n=1 Tax=Streptomyces cellostaticus TaxID=67285 RepID=UPI0020270DEC|nr:hypothetical protein [Streptomyces cellostaticus]
MVAEILLTDGAPKLSFGVTRRPEARLRGGRPVWARGASGRGRPTRHLIGPHCRILATTNALGHTTRFRYDASGNLLSRTDPLGATNGLGYDDPGAVRVLPAVVCGQDVMVAGEEAVVADSSGCASTCSGRS